MVAKNELIKGMRGKKFLVSLAVILLVFVLITVIPYATGGTWSGKAASDILSSYLSYISMISLLIVALLSSVAIVSEFEERTALILFTRPIKRTTIFLGKLMACFAITALIMLVYYLLVTAMLAIFAGTIPWELIISLCFCLLYVFAASGIAFFISAFLKKSSVATIITLLGLLMVIPIVSTMIGGDTWYMLDTAGNTIITCVPEYVDSYNAIIYEWVEYMQKAIDYMNLSGDAEIMQVAAIMQGMVDSYMFGMMEPIATPDLLREAGILIAWGVSAYFIAWLKFIRREF